jgi:hypothetical protein
MRNILKRREMAVIVNPGIWLRHFYFVYKTICGEGIPKTEVQFLVPFFIYEFDADYTVQETKGITLCMKNRK